MGDASRGPLAPQHRVDKGAHRQFFAGSVRWGWGRFAHFIALAQAHRNRIITLRNQLNRSHAGAVWFACRPHDKQKPYWSRRQRWRQPITRPSLLSNPTDDPRRRIPTAERDGRAEWFSSVPRE